jgi:predicted DNA-binding transcriptional regulator AlpA
MTGNDRPTELVPRLALRLDEVAAALGVSRTLVDRERSAGRFPPPDLHLSKTPLWTPDTLRRWLTGSLQPQRKGVR